MQAAAPYSVITLILTITLTLALALTLTLPLPLPLPLTLTLFLSHDQEGCYFRTIFHSHFPNNNYGNGIETTVPGAQI